MNKQIQDSIEHHVTCILELIGEDINREGLIKTPYRVAKSYEEMFRGYHPSERPRMTKFKSNSDRMILKKDIPFYSMCEHHMIPYFGRCHVAYIPDNSTIIGMSKITRLVQYLSAKLTVQEELTSEIADELEKELNPKGVAVTTIATHLCEGMRGVRVSGSEFDITELRGIFLDGDKAHKEFMYKTLG